VAKYLNIGFKKYGLINSVGRFLDVCHMHLDLDLDNSRQGSYSRKEIVRTI